MFRVIPVIFKPNNECLSCKCRCPRASPLESTAQCHSSFRFCIKSCERLRTSPEAATAGSARSKGRLDRNCFVLINQSILISVAASSLKELAELLNCSSFSELELISQLTLFQQLKDHFQQPFEGTRTMPPKGHFSPKPMPKPAKVRRRADPHDFARDYVLSELSGACKLCQKVVRFSRSSKGNLRRHLQENHPGTIGRTSAAPSSSQIKAHFPRGPPLPALDRDQFQLDLVRWIAAAMLPLSTVDHPLFHQVFRGLLGPVGYTDADIANAIPTRAALTKAVQKEATAVVARSRASLAAYGHYAVTADLWTSTSNHSVFASTVHAVSDDWKLKQFTLPSMTMGPLHTSLAQSDAILRTIECLPPPVAVVTDNAASIVKAVRDLPVMMNIRHVRCCAHSLQRCVADTIGTQSETRKGDPEARALLSKCRKVVGHFSHSPGAQLLLDGHATANQRPRRLVRDVPTRWNSSYLMMQSLIPMRLPLAAYSAVQVADDHAGLNLPTIAEWGQIADLVRILSMFNRITTQLSASMYPTLCTTYLFLHCMLQFLRDESVPYNDVPFSTRLRHCAANAVEKRFDMGCEDSPLVHAALYHPMCKRYIPVPLARRLLLQVLVHPPASNAVALDAVDLDAVDLDAVDLDAVPDELLAYACVPACPDVVPVAPLRPEEIVELYLQDLNQAQQPLDWWRTRGASTYPRLVQAAKRWLCIPATSAPCERLFSVHGGTITKRRNRIHPTMADALVVIHQDVRAVMTEPDVDNNEQETYSSCSDSSDDDSAPGSDSGCSV
jgi:hypothetical protein